MAYRNTALVLAAPDIDSDDTAWAERGAHLREMADPPEGLPSLWVRAERKPLVLTGHDVRLRINHGALELETGSRTTRRGPERS